MAQERPRGPRVADSRRGDSQRARVSEPQPQHRPPGRPPSLPRPSSASSLLLLLPPPWSLAGRARHGAASPPMALRRSMGRSGLPPLPRPPPPPPLLLLAGLAVLLLPEPAAAGRGCPGGGGERGAAEGRGGDRSPGTAAGRARGLGGPKIRAEGSKLEGRGSGAGEGGSAVGSPRDLGLAPRPNFLASGLFWRGSKERSGAAS